MRAAAFASNLLALLCLAPAATIGAPLVNLSTRGFAEANGEPLTAGFVISGVAPKRVLIRAAGPALARFGVTGALPAVRLELFRAGTSLAVNTGWDTGSDAVAITQAAAGAGAFQLDAGSKDAAMLATLAPGAYTAQVTPGGATSGVALVEIYDADTASPSQLINVSTRARVGGNENALIAGFVVRGETSPRVLVRGVGPSLTRFGVAGAAIDPQLEVFRDATSVAYNDDWQHNTNAAQLDTVAQNSGAFAFASAAKDAALLLPATSGAYTAQVTGSGIALVEVYDTTAYLAPPPARVFDLVGFARVAGHGLAALTGGGTPTTPYDPVARSGNFWRIDDATAASANFATQLQAALSSDAPLVVELNTMLDLSRVGRANTGSPAIAHPDLFAAGRTTGTVGTLALGANKTIYSAYGNGGFKRGTLTITGKSNIALRNLQFRELWEWDDATRGDYDRNNWDYLTISSATDSNGNVMARAHHIWIDHCDFEKAYDGLADIIHGADLVTISWCKVAGVVSGESARWLRHQMDYLEANRDRFPYYASLRATESATEILAKETFQKKSNLVGNGTDAVTAGQDTGFLNVTFHHNWYVNVDQRMPRMRFGNAHVFNLLVDSSEGRGVTGLVLAGVAATSGAAVRVDNSWFIDARTPISNNAGTEPNGNVAVVNSVNLDSATRADRGFDAARVTPLASFAWNQPAAAAGLAPWPRPDTSAMPAGYVPANRTLADYLDANDYLASHLAFVGIIAPASESEAGQLRVAWQAATGSR